MSQSCTKIHVASSVDIIETDAFLLDKTCLHYTFGLDASGRWLQAFFNKAWKKGVRKISFKNGSILYSNLHSNKASLLQLKNLNTE